MAHFVIQQCERFASAAAVAFLVSAIWFRPAAADDPICEGVPIIANHDGSWEWGYTWGYELETPDIGAFAERFRGPGVVCGTAVYLTGIIGMEVAIPDLFIYASDDGTPGQVLAFRARAFVSGVALWPGVSRHTAEINAIVEGDFFAGIQIWYGDSPPFIASDLDGPGGYPRTNVPPGQDVPAGWTHPDDVWHDGCKSLGIEVHLESAPTSTRNTTWGSIKSLFE